MDAIQGHMPFSLARYIPDDARCVTILRDPVDRLTSTYAYFLEKKPERREVLLSQNISIEEFAVSGDFILDNLQTRMLSGRNPPFGECTEKMLIIAKRNLERFTLAGLTERFDEVLALMAEVFGWGDLRYENRNVSASRVARNQLPVGTVRAIEECDALDVQLHHYARTLFADQLRRSRSS